MNYRELNEYYRKLDNIVDMMRDISYYTIGQGNCEVRVNGKTLMELDIEREKIFWAKREIRSDVSEVCSYHNSVYLTKDDANELNNLLMISRVISDNPTTFVTEEVASLINMCGDKTQYNIIEF